ncbi:alpha/beta fold hydrolase [Mesonia aquimarina]|uniref:alpha/beta fold hydrolase n=1 Tax=Mesonia aquimarina TaxID=1504967 RepID=UPI000EF5E584|nr:alpha/beta hydrolase [Mesonia aquimarina]
MKKLNICFIVIILLIAFSMQSQESFQVTKTGKGQPILLFPGFTCTPEVFSEITTHLSENYEIHAFTFAGFGEVSPISFPWLPKIKKEIQSYVIENKLKDVIILGHSMGGSLGLWLASENNNYSKLILIDALPAIGALMLPDYNSKTITYDSPYNQKLLAMDSLTFTKMAKQMTQGMSLNKDKHQQIVDWIVQADRKTYVYGYTDLLKLDLRKAIKEIEIPVHIFAATHPYGKETTALNYQKQYQNLKDYKINFADGSGHFIMYEKPQWLRDQIETALQSNE